MKEIKGNLWDYYGREGYVCCITTNGALKKNGAVVMGRGCAREARDRFSGIDFAIGKDIWNHGLRTLYLVHYNLIVFPVKYHWRTLGQLDLIRNSAEELAQLVAYRSPQTYILPRPGCGNGGLSWEDEVRPVLDRILPDYVEVIDFE